MVDKNTKNISDAPNVMSIPVSVFWIGLFGGVFWTIIGYFAYLLSFTEIRPTIILEPWTVGDWEKGWLGTLITIVLMGFLSVLAAFIYFGLLRRLKGIWAGFGYGIILFIIVFIILNPMFPSMDPFLKLKRDTFITSICLFIVYGIFIGYSISYEWQTQKVQDKEPVN